MTEKEKVTNLLLDAMNSVKEMPEDKNGFYLEDTDSGLVMLVFPNSLGALAHATNDAQNKLFKRGNERLQEAGDPSDPDLYTRAAIIFAHYLMKQKEKLKANDLEGVEITVEDMAAFLKRYLDA